MKKSQKVPERTFNWKKYPDKKPSDSGVYVIIVHKPTSYLLLDNYPSLSKRALMINQNKIVVWGRWSYAEELENITDDHLIYRKNYMFVDMDNQQIHNVSHWLELPLYPEGIDEN